MLFEDILSVKCLPLPTFELSRLEYHGFKNVGRAKQDIDSLESSAYYWSEMRRDFHKALSTFRESIADLGLVTIANASEPIFSHQTILNYVNPRTMLQNFTVKFRVNKEIVDDFVIRNMRKRHDVNVALNSLGVTTLRELVNKDYDSCTRKLGSYITNRLYDVIVFLREICVFSFDSELNKSFVCRELPKGVLTVGYVFNDEISRYDLFVSVEEIIDGLLPLGDLIAAQPTDAINTRQFLCDVDLMTAVYSQLFFISIAQRIIVKVIESKYRHGLNIKGIDEWLPQSMSTAGGAARFLPELLEKDYVEEYCSYYHPKSWSILDYAKSIEDDLLAQIAQYRLAGKGLAAISKLVGISTIELQHIIPRIWCSNPAASEDKYTYWFCRYKFYKAEFCQIIDVDGYVFDYLNDIFYKGKADIQEIINDPEATEEMKVRVLAVLDERQRKQEVKEERAIARAEKQRISRIRKMLLNPAELRSVRFNVLREVLQSKHSNEPCTISYLCDEFQQYCDENNLPEVTVQKTPERVFERFLRDSEFRCVMMSSDGLVRFYDMETPDNQELIADLHLEDYDNLFVSSQIIYNANILLLQSHDLRDSYEFNFWLRKNQASLPVRIEFKNAMMLAIGNANRREQILNVLKEHAPMTKNQLAVLLRERYGIESGFSTHTWLKEVADLYVCRMYRLDTPTLSTEGIAALSKLLIEDFYFIDDVEKLYKERFTQAPPLDITDALAQKLGFHLYGNYMLSTSYETPQFYFSQWFVGERVVDLNKIDPRYCEIPELHECIDKLCREHKLFKVGPLRYATYDKGLC